METYTKLKSRRRTVWFIILALFLIGVASRSLDYDAAGAIAFLAIFLGMFYVLLLGYYIRREEKSQAHNETISEGDPALPPYWKILVGNLVFAGFVFLLCSSSALLASLSLLVVIGVLLPMSLSAAKGTRELRRQRWTRFIIYALAASAGWMADHQAGDAEQKNYNDIIVAVERYKTVEKHYPETLQQLVPTYLAAVPSSRWGKYMYSSNGIDDAHLTHMPMPYLRESYNFKSKTRKTWD